MTSLASDTSKKFRLWPISVAAAGAWCLASLFAVSIAMGQSPPVVAVDTYRLTLNPNVYCVAAGQTITLSGFFTVTSAVPGGLPASYFREDLFGLDPTSPHLTPVAGSVTQSSNFNPPIGPAYFQDVINGGGYLGPTSFTGPTVTTTSDLRTFLVPPTTPPGTYHYSYGVEFDPVSGPGFFDTSLTINVDSGLCITSPSDGASPQSQFVALSGTGTPGNKLNVLVDAISVGSVVVDSEGNWEGLPYVSLYGSPVTVQVQDQTSSDFSNTITVHPSLATFSPGPPNPINSLTALLPLRKADILVAASDTSPQYVLYGPNYTHVALYLGGDVNGTPLIAEAVTPAEAGPLIGTGGQVRSIPLDQSLAWTQSNRISAWHPQIALPGATRNAIVASAANFTSQAIPYWSVADFGLIPAANTLFEHGGNVLSPRVNIFLGDLNALKNSTSAFICSTLVWRAYYEGSSHTLDLSSPNLLSAQPGSLMANYDPAFIAQLARVFIVPETFVRSPLLRQIF